MAVVLILVAVPATLALAASICVIKPYERAVVFRLGRVVSTRAPDCGF